jgi:GxxExxY protein
MRFNELSGIVIDTCMTIHRRLGPGLLESVDQEVLLFELRKRGLRVEKEVPIPVVWEDVQLDVGFRADLLVENQLIVELKSIEAVAPVHKKILLTYLRLADKRLGLLINFGEELLKNGITRVVNGFVEYESPSLRRWGRRDESEQQTAFSAISVPLRETSPR